MKAKVNKKSITVTGIWNESNMEDLFNYIKKSEVSHKYTDIGSTKMKITGTPDQLNKFIKCWNGEDEETPSPAKHSVGDIVSIKEWDTLVNELGLSEYGHIDSEVYLLKENKDMCGKEVIVKFVNPYTQEYSIVFDNETYYCYDDIVA